MAATDESKPVQRSYYVSNLRVRGFWNDQQLSISFDRHVNFLIGPNGTGKTTIVNFLNAILSADFRSLDRLNFSMAEVDLSPANEDRDVVTIEVSKIEDASTALSAIQYNITDARGKKIFSFSFGDIEERLSLRDPRHFSRRRLAAKNVAQDAISAMVDLSWLSVHRHDTWGGDRAELGVESLVDLKLDAQSNQLVRYFSKLDQRSAAALSDFQKSVFLSLLSGQEDSADLWDEFDFDVRKERDELIPILEKFRIQKSRYHSKVQKHFEVLHAAMKSVKDGEGLSSNEAVAIVNQRRIHEVVQEWAQTVSNQKEIYRVRDAFVRILNDMFINKDVSISATNEVVVRYSKGRTMPIRSLSSGEKQLMILMSQALLQDCKPSIFIADEPELSLHVVWQERLVDCIRELNPAAQVIFATHSPDIVGEYLDKVIESTKVFVK